MSLRSAQMRIAYKTIEQKRRKLLLGSGDAGNRKTSRARAFSEILKIQMEPDSGASDATVREDLTSGGQSLHP